VKRTFLIGAGIALAMTVLAVVAITWGTADGPRGASAPERAAAAAPGSGAAPASESSSWWRFSSPGPATPAPAPGTSPHARNAPEQATGPEPTGRPAPPAVERRRPGDPLPPAELHRPDRRKHRVTSAQEGAEYNRSP
jgi:hypothetical protein